jgi:hypothetical protein
MESTLISIISAFAPTVADRLIPMIKDHKLKREELELVRIALEAEQNAQSLETLKRIQDNLEGIHNCISSMNSSVKETNEGVTVLLTRTKPK